MRKCRTWTEPPHCSCRIADDLTGTYPRSIGEFFDAQLQDEDHAFFRPVIGDRSAELPDTIRLSNLLPYPSTPAGGSTGGPPRSVQVGITSSPLVDWPNRVCQYTPTRRRISSSWSPCDLIVSTTSSTLTAYFRNCVDQDRNRCTQRLLFWSRFLCAYMPLAISISRSCHKSSLRSI